MSERHSTSLLFKVGLRYNEEANTPGAQTERRGLAGPVSVLRSGWDSPAALLELQRFLCGFFFGYFFLPSTSSCASWRRSWSVRRRFQGALASSGSSS